MGSSRREFFRRVVDRTVGKAADRVGDSLECLGTRVRVRLRPPGALGEAAFRRTCRRCASCVEACPARAIRQVGDDGGEAAGTPYIEARVQPCLVCDSLACMTACPSGALQRVPRQVLGMGHAVVDAGRCHRSRGEACRVCVDLCPYGEAALRIDAAGALQVGGGCTGCGICEWKCPAAPAAVTVVPG